METWYILTDGSFAHPADVSEKDGVWQSGGVPVAFGAHGNPLTRGMSAEDIAAAKKEVKPEEPKRHYKTRESKAS